MKKALLILASFFSVVNIFSQSAPYCPSINAQLGTGPSTTICQGNCTTLSSSVVPVNLTTTYSVGSIPYSPFSFTSGTSVIANQDDIWSGVINLGFPFCYFGNTYNQCVIGSNGQLTFSLGLANGYDAWSISAALPNTTNMPGNTICAAFRDIDPTLGGNIYYAYYGTAPCRSMVISWNNIPLFSSSCSPNSTFQLVLHETTNYIDVFIKNSTACSSWNSGYGIVGIQNINASIGVAAPGRNYPTAWTGVNEGWRFTPTGAQTYTVNWKDPSGIIGTGLNVAVCPSVTTTYTANMMVSACSNVVSTYSSVVQVSVVPGPTLVTNSPTICGGGNATLTVSGATTYTWLPGNSNATSIVVSPTATTTYTVLGKTGTSCASSQTTQVTVSPSPTATPGSNSPICAGSTLSLTTNAAASYTWSGPNSFSSNVQNPTIPNTSTLAAGQYTVNVTSAGGCTATAVVNVVVNPAPGVTANNNGPICANQTLSLTSVGSGPFSWTGPNAFSSATQNPTIPSASTLAAGVYSVIAGVGSCTALATTTVVINALPTPTASNTGPYCAGSTIQLNVGAFSTYTWSGPSFSSNSQNPTIPSSTTANSGTYTVTVTSASGCTASATTSVTVNPIPTPVVGSNSPLCAGATLSLTSSGGNTYSWNGPNSFSSALQNPTVVSVTSANAGVYTVTVTSAAGCVKTGTVSVTVTTPTSTAANTGPYCAGQTINLSTPAATTYTWSGPNSFSSNAQNPTIANSATVASGVYTVNSTTSGCSSTATTNVIVNALPTPTASNTGPYCPGNTIQLNVGAFSTYTWNGPSSFNSNSQNPTQPNAQTTNGGVYTVSVTNTQGCVNTATTNVVVNPNPVVNVSSNNPVCLNTSINLTSGGGTSYAWSGPNSFSSALQNPTIANAALTDAGIYTVTVTALGCSNTGTVNVIVITPTASAANTGPYCAGSTINLSATAATSYTWTGPAGYNSNAQNATQANATVLMAGTYTLNVSIGTCTASATTNVIVNALPTPTAQNSSPVCAGQTINFTGLGGTTYTWTGPSSYSSTQQNPVINNASAGNAGLYILVVTDANGCSDSATTNVIVNPLPVIAVNSPTNCVNTTINLTSNGGVSYSWSGPNSFSSNVQNPNIPSAQLNMSGVYVVTVTDVNGCVNTASANVVVLPVPIPNIVSNSPVCVGGTLNLQGSGGASYLWNGPGYTGTNQNPSINNVSTGAAGVYTLLVSSGTCTASTTYTVVINPNPVFNFVNTNVLCNGQSNGTSTVNVTIGTGPYNYNWSTSPIQTSQAASNLSAGTYTCLVTDANGCSSLASTNITQPTIFTVSVNSSATSACAGVPINAIANGNGGTAPYNYNWVSGPATSVYAINETGAGNYIYTVNATDANGCTAMANLGLTFFQQPTVTATSATLCAGQSTVLTAQGAASYTWQPGNVVGSSYAFNGNSSVNITVTGSSNGCNNTFSTAVVVSPNPNGGINVSSNKGCVPACIDFNASGSPSVVSYNWVLNGAGITGSVNGSYCFQEAASYTLGLTVMDAFGCTGTTNPVIVTIYPKPVADFNHAPIKPIVNVDQEVTFTDASHDATITAWNWYFMNTAQYTSTLQNPTFSYTEPGTYAVALVVKSSDGCMDTLVREIVVGEDFGIYVPNAFTPNGDGLNDLFQPKGFGVTKYEINIFDRWGESVFHTNKFEEGWDGSFKGRSSKPVEEGVYTWLINCTDVFGKSHELKGHVTLMK